jgi:uncharacterized integral membrane protein (TIGR00697 family)
MLFNSRKDLVFIVLAGFFVTNAVVGELIGGKLIQLGPLTMSIGIIPWPIVFLSTDLINEYYGKKGVQKLTLLTAILIIYTFIILYFALKATASPISPIKDDVFYQVFGQSMWIIVGSITAFLISQMIDVVVFWLLRSKTGGKMIWLRSTGSTVVSQLIDSFIVTGIAFWLPGKLSFNDFITTAATGYSGKLIIAILLTPFIYLFHDLIHKFIGAEESERIINEAAIEALGEKAEEKTGH